MMTAMGGTNDMSKTPACPANSRSFIFCLSSL
jgi:hypothetical protein